MNNKNIIKSISYDQNEILQWIIKLYCPEGFELDPTYSKGNFYKKIKPPKYKFDLYNQEYGARRASAVSLPFQDNFINNIVFDPPFVISYGPSLKKRMKKSNVIANRFGYFKSPKQLWQFYEDSIKEAYRILKENGVYIFKCQDTVSSGKQYISHLEIMSMAVKQGFYLKDVFILLAKSRVISGKHKNQQHARKFHSYFLVFIKQESPVKYRYLNGENL